MCFRYFCRLMEISNCFTRNFLVTACLFWVVYRRSFVREQPGVSWYKKCNVTLHYGVLSTLFQKAYFFSTSITRSNRDTSGLCLEGTLLPCKPSVMYKEKYLAPRQRVMKKKAFCTACNCNWSNHNMLIKFSSSLRIRSHSWFFSTSNPKSNFMSVF